MAKHSMGLAAKRRVSNIITLLLYTHALLLSSKVLRKHPVNVHILRK